MTFEQANLFPAPTLSHQVSGLTVLSYGGGQDSKAILTMLITDPEARQKYAPDHLVVVMADTGDEHDYTYEDIHEVRTMCRDAKIHFKLIRGSEGYHAPSWPDLISPQLRAEGGKYKPSMVQLNTKSCTANLKLVPIYKWLDEYVNLLAGYGFKVQPNHGCKKQAIKKWHAENGKITMLIGFAKGEEKRVKSAERIEVIEQNDLHATWKPSITRRFPLIEEGMTREDAQKYIADKGYNCPPPSNCMRCPYQSLPEILWLHRNHPEKYAEWELIEANKLARNTDAEKNYGVYNRKGKTLADQLAEAQAKFGHWTDEKLNNYKFSHGCTQNGM